MYQSRSAAPRHLSYSIVSVDWANTPSSRAVYTVESTPPYVIKRRKPPAEGWNLRSLIDLSNEISRRTEGATLIAVDAVIGIPRRFAKLTRTKSFLRWLDKMAASGLLMSESQTPEEWSPARPFFRVPKGQGAKSAFENRFGGRNCTLRLVDNMTKGNSVFVLSGIPGVVGSGSRELWNQITSLSRFWRRKIKIWPFETSLESTQPPELILGESYPKALYGVALDNQRANASDRSPYRSVFIRKGIAKNRIERLDELISMQWIREFGVRIENLKHAQDSQDDFDALFVAAALLRIQLENKDLSSKYLDEKLEGGMLGTRDTEFSGKIYRTLPEAARTETTEITPTYFCPIDGCEMAFQNGRAGWDAHVSSLRRHPDWHPNVSSTRRRRELFKREFKDWFYD